tara:strand:- start:2746 stop:3369 length:624 start_codon:yes stop_codon:yes gene_type:complete
MTQETEYILSDPVKPPAPPIVPGTEVLKSPFTSEQLRAAGFAVRMEAALKQLDDLELAGFNPHNMRDFFVNNIVPFTPEFIDNYFSSPEYKQYMRARIDFASAQLRQETGATIAESEIVWIDQTYFPAPGDDEQTIEAKREARKKALAAMIGVAGKAYDGVKKDTMESGYGFERDSAKEFALERAKTDLKFRQKLIDAGLVTEDDFK